MKIFFSTTPRARDRIDGNIKLIYQILHKEGYTLTEKYIEHITKEEFYSWTEKDKKKYFQETISSIKDADVTVFEVSTASLGVGVLLSKALIFERPVIALYVKGQDAFMLESSGDERIILVEYTKDTLKSKLLDAVDYAKEQMFVRYNFFLPPNLSRYLTWISTKKKIPRSVFIRGLIEENLTKNTEYFNDTG